MKTPLTSVETRVLASLIEKEMTTPDQYPLSLNALTNACNQKSNREPVMDLKESEVQAAVDSLKKRFLVSIASGYGSRVDKFQHRFCNTEFGELKLPKPAVAILCELMLRGPQTPGELRTRAERMTPVTGVEQVEDLLNQLSQRDEPLVFKLAREPGRREARYMQLLSGDTPPPMVSAGPGSTSTSVSLSDRERITELEVRLAALEAEFDALKRSLGE